MRKRFNKNKRSYGSRVRSLARRVNRREPKTDNKVYFFRQSGSGSSPVVLNAALQQTNLVFSAAMIDSTQWQTFTNLFDQYKIYKVTFILQPMIIAPTQANFGLPFVHSVIDYDGNFPGSTLTEAKYEDYQSHRYHNPYKITRRSFKPQVLTTAVSGSGTGYAQMGTPWLDTANPNINHYGASILWPVSDTYVGDGNTSYQYTVKVIIHFAFRNVR